MANIQNIRSVGNPQRAYEFEVEILASTSAGALPILTQRVESVSIPENSVETIEINYKGRKTIHAGRDSSSHAITVSFWDAETRDVYNFIKRWMENGISNSAVGGGTNREDYATQMLIRTYAADSTKVTGINRLTNVFPTSLGEVRLDYASSEHMKFDVTFSYDSSLLF
jgi:hypothetical protein